MLDGEIVVPRGEAFSFDDLLQRIHPAASRVQKLAAETPALLIVFDLLVDEKGDVLVDAAAQRAARRARSVREEYLRGDEDIRLSPATTELARRKKWLKQVGATLDGIVAKRLRPAVPVRQPRTACRRSRISARPIASSADSAMAKAQQLVGSLLLGLYDDEGLLDHVGFTSASRTTSEKRADAEIGKADRAARLHWR